ncbi:hypothetical protein CR513_36634, partial [Mucuna pruriens]
MTSEPTGMTIQLANRSIVQPLGVLEDVLVQVNGLIFPADFYVLDMEDESSIDPLYDLDPEIDKTFHRLRKVGNTIIVDSSSSDSIFNFENSNFATDESHFYEYPETGSITLKELVTPDVVYQPLCIQYPQLEPAQTYELKSGLIHLLPKFHGVAGEDPHNHLKEFHVVCSTMRS